MPSSPCDRAARLPASVAHRWRRAQPHWSEGPRPALWSCIHSSRSSTCPSPGRQYVACPVAAPPPAARRHAQNLALAPISARRAGKHESLLHARRDASRWLLPGGQLRLIASTVPELEVDNVVRCPAAPSAASSCARFGVWALITQPQTDRETNSGRLGRRGHHSLSQGRDPATDGRSSEPRQA